MEVPAYLAINRNFINKRNHKRLMIVFKTLLCQRVIQRKRCFVCGFDSHCKDVKNYNLVTQFKIPAELIKKNKIEHIDILSSGSILDPKQVDYEQVLKLMKKIRELKGIKNILIEGRVEYCDTGKLQQIKQILGNVELEYGIGLESYSDYVRNIVLRKDLKLKDYLNCLRKLTKIKVGICTYILAGIPNLSQDRSLTETKNSIIKVVDLYRKYNCRGRIALFPIFIAPGTPLEDLYNEGRYRLITLSDILNILLEVKQKINLKEYPIFVGLDDENISRNRYVIPQNKREKKLSNLIEKFNSTQEL